jgi:PAS domain S-box-containing protein
VNLARPGPGIPQRVPAVKIAAGVAQAARPASGGEARMDELARPAGPTVGTASAAGRVFDGPGEMRARCRALDWAATPLGPVEAWPESLRTAAQTALAHPFPHALLWGPELVQIYNDGYRELMGVKHPAGLGQPTRACWPEVWHINAPIYERVRAGESRALTDTLLPITRTGTLEDAWFTLSYSPVRDEAGAVAGVLVTIFETTEYVAAERRLREANADAARAMDRLGASEARYRSLFESIEEGFCVVEILVDADGRPHDYRFLEANPGFERHTGLAGAVGRTMRELAPEHEAHWYETYGRIARTGVPERFEAPARALAQREFDVYAFRIDRPEERRVAILFKDVTARLAAGAFQREMTGHLAEWNADLAARVAERDGLLKALTTSEARYRTLVDNVEDYAIFLLDAAGVITEWTPGAERVKGYTAAEAVGQPLALFYTPEDVAAGAVDRELAEAAATGRVEREGWRVRKGGARFWANEIATAVRDPDGRLVGFTKIARDLTERRLGAQAVERAQLAAARDDLRRQLAAAEEAERRRLARELHDQLGQELTAFRLGLDDAARLATALAGATARTSEDAPAAPVLARLAQLQALAGRMTAGVRYLALELRPPELDDLGLESALETYVAEWSARYGVQAEVAVTGLRAERDVAAEVGSTLYRIAQEALTNVAKHAKATHVSVIVEKPDGEVRLIVEDDGRGFEPEATAAQVRAERRLGLAGMRERAALVRGTLTVESSPSGTTLYVRVPVDGATGPGEAESPDLRRPAPPG